jgi:hypothetical protein
LSSRDDGGEGDVWMSCHAYGMKWSLIPTPLK